MKAHETRFRRDRPIWQYALAGLLAGLASVAFLTVPWPWDLLVVAGLVASLAASSRRWLLAPVGFVAGALCMLAGFLLVNIMDEPWLPTDAWIAIGVVTAMFGVWAIVGTNHAAPAKNPDRKQHSPANPTRRPGAQPDAPMDDSSRGGRSAGRPQ